MLNRLFFIHEGEKNLRFCKFHWHIRVQRVNVFFFSMYIEIVVIYAWSSRWQLEEKWSLYSLHNVELCIIFNLDFTENFSSSSLNLLNPSPSIAKILDDGYCPQLCNYVPRNSIFQPNWHLYAFNWQLEQKWLKRAKVISSSSHSVLRWYCRGTNVHSKRSLSKDISLGTASVWPRDWTEKIFHFSDFSKQQVYFRSTHSYLLLSFALS